jgi:hypothetical protein
MGFYAKVLIDTRVLDPDWCGSCGLCHSEDFTRAMGSGWRKPEIGVTKAGDRIWLRHPACQAAEKPATFKV